MICLAIKLKGDMYVHMPSTYLLIKHSTNATEIMIMSIIFFHVATTSGVSLFNFELCLSHSAPSAHPCIWACHISSGMLKVFPSSVVSPSFAHTKIKSSLGVSETVPG